MTRILSLENENEKLKADCTFAVNDSEEAHEAVAKLEREIERIVNSKNESSDAVDQLEVLKSSFKVLENKLDDKEKELVKAVELQKKYKTEIKCLDAKVEKIKSEAKGFKSEKENLEKEVNKFCCS